MAAQIGQRRTRRQPVAHQHRRRLRHQHLPPIPDRSHPRSPVHLQAHQAGSRLRRFPAVDAHPHPHPLPARPRMALKGLLHLQHRRHTPPRRGEHREKAVPHGVHLAAVMRGQRRPDQRMMPRQHLRVDVFPQPPEQRRRALNVSKQKREGLHPPSVEGPAGWRHSQQPRHHARPAPPGWPPAAGPLAASACSAARRRTPQPESPGASGPGSHLPGRRDAGRPAAAGRLPGWR